MKCDVRSASLYKASTFRSGALTIGILSMALIVSGFLICGPRSHTAKKELVLLNGAYSQMSIVYESLKVDISEMDFGSTNAVAHVVRDIGKGSAPGQFEIFRLQTGTNRVWLAINPNQESWRFPMSNSDAIAMYWPVQTGQIMRSPAASIPALTFGARTTLLHEIPLWNPVDIEALSRE
jgi:hypothetical protein